MAAPAEQPEKPPRLMVEEASREDLVKQVKRQLALLQKAKAKCDDLNKKCELKDATIKDLQGQRQRWQQDHAELQELRQAYQSLQEAQEKQYQSFQVLEEELAMSNENLVTWHHKYQEVLENLECTQSKMAALNQGTECLRQELQSLEEKNKVANSKIEQLSQSQKQLHAERAIMQQQLNALEQEKCQEPAGSDSALEMSPSRMKKKIEELVAQCSTLMQERDMCNSAREVLAQEAESANEEAASLRQKISVLLEERSSLENQRDEKINECNLLQEEKHGLERQLSDLYQNKEDLEAKEKEFAKILDDNSSLEKLLAEAVNENTELQESVNNLQEKLREAETEKHRLTKELETSKDLALSESNRLEAIIRSLEDKLAAQIEQHQNVEHELKVCVCQQIESEKLIQNLKASLSSCQRQEDLVDIVSTAEETSETPDNQMALEKLKEAMEEERKSAVTRVGNLEEALKKLHMEKADLEEEIAKIKKADRQLFEELQTSVSKVSLLEKDLTRSFHEKQNIVDELCQVKDLQRFLEDEATELQQECEKLKAQAGRLEADLDNDRLHIQKLEHELEAAECRDQQSLREVEMLRLQLKEMALQALKYQEAFRDCVPGNMEPQIMWKAFHRICQIILEAAEKNLVDIQVEGMLPGIGATLVLNDFGDEFGAVGENREEDREGAVSAEAHEQLRSALENVEEQLHMTLRALNVLQFEKQAIEDELLLEKSRRDCLNKEFTASAKQMYLLEEQIADIEMQLEQKRKELNEKDEFLAKALDQITGIRADFEKLEDMKQGHSRLSPELCMLDSSGKEGSDLQDFRKKWHAELIARMSHLELDLKRANHVTDLTAPNQAEASGGEHSGIEGVGIGRARTSPLPGDRVCDDVDMRQHRSDSVSDMEIKRDENENFSDNCSSPRACLLKSSETQESTCEEVLMLKAELQAKSKLLDQVHSKLDDQLEQSEKLERTLIGRSKDLQDCRNDVLKKDSELAALTAQLTHLKDQLVFYEKECNRLCAVFQPEFNNEAKTQNDMLCEWYSAHRTMLKLLSQLILHASRQQHPQVLSDGNGDSNVLLEARRLHAALSEKLDSISFEEEPSSSLPCVISRAVCQDLVTELALIKSFEQMLETLSVGGTKNPLPKPRVEPEVERQDSYKEIAYLQRSLQEKEEKLTKFKALVLKLKKDVADKTKQVNFMEKELSGMKQELDMNAQASKQSVQNFQILQNEYDSLQDKNEATLSMCKDLEGKLASSVNELDAAKHALVDATSEKNTLKQINEVLNAEVMAWQECKAKLEAKLSSMESQASDAKEQEEKLLGHIKVLEEQVSEANKQLLAEKEEHTKTAAQLEKVHKESQIHKLLDLEIADFEHTVAELNKLLKEKNDQLDNIRKESLAYQSKIASLAEQISFLEDQKKADDERLLAYKETVANLKEELLKSRKCEEELRQAEVRLESEVKAGQLREQDLKKSYATVSQELLVLDSTLRTDRERHRQNIRTLESDIASLRGKLQSANEELQNSKVEFEKYKVRAHSVLKQRRKNAAGTDNTETTDAHSQGVIDQMKRQIEHLAEQLQRSQAETKTARDDYDLVAQQHQSVLLELEKQQKEWRNRLDEVVKQNSVDMGNELEKQLNLQYEKLTTKYQNKLAEQEAEHEQVLQQHLQTIEALKREVAEIQLNPQRPSSPQEELAAVGDISTLERQAAEGSESVSPAQPLLLQTVPWELVPTGSAATLESLLNPRSMEAPPHDKTDDKSVRHLAELLNESESNNLRMTEQIRVLKEEIRRHERNYERQKHAVNLEYLKNIIMKFVTLRGGSEKERLVPVLTTMLKLSPEEKKDLEAVVTKEMQQDAAGASNWGGYLPRWTGFVG
ncbi:GRIP and coiled-coil domain-containing protein 2 isoform X2 [Rhipicephalus sanguineus]|uniref:GRIP and coiled-coil domain-containing protein 2 isoform X2 n=1 Tax=Rhipicephalus sanguineus TaxID=34632 RepID=UPI0018950A4D|nr:GRIP and coiled-coil domain-containing protein 2 isoform X2 [Rhipicephalus sanguineus]